jgi:hypothetical protein
MSISQIPPAPFEPAPFEDASDEPPARPLSLVMTGAMVLLATGLCGLLLVRLWPF